MLIFHDVMTPNLFRSDRDLASWSNHFINILACCYSTRPATTVLGSGSAPVREITNYHKYPGRHHPNATATRGTCNATPADDLNDDPRLNLLALLARMSRYQRFTSNETAAHTKRRQDTTLNKYKVMVR